MNKFNEIVKEFSDPDTPGNEKRIKKIIKDIKKKLKYRSAYKWRTSLIA